MEEVHLMQERDPAAKAIVFSQVKSSLFSGEASLFSIVVHWHNHQNEISGRTLITTSNEILRIYSKGEILIFFFFIVRLGPYDSR